MGSLVEPPILTLGSRPVPVLLTYHGVQKPHVVQEPGVHLLELPEVHFHQDSDLVPEGHRAVRICMRTRSGELQIWGRQGPTEAHLKESATGDSVGHFPHLPPLPSLIIYVSYVSYV